MKEIKLVSVDLDDTLCLTEEACFNMENSVAEQMGFPPMTRETHKSNWGLPIEIAIGQRIPGIDPAEFEKRLAVEIPKFVERGELDSIPGENLEALEKLKTRGKIITVLTSRTKSEALHLLDPIHVLAKIVSDFYHKDNSLFVKPDPRAFQAMLEKYNLSPNQAVYIGDSLGDAKSAEAAGLHFIASLESGLKTEEDFSGISVDYFIKRFPEIVKIIS